MLLKNKKMNRNLVTYLFVCLFVTFLHSRAENGKIDLEKLTQKAQMGDAQAQYELGRVYYDGREVNRDLEVAFGWLLKAAKQGHADAQYNTGRCYFHGRGVPRDKKIGLSWFYEAALQDHQQATYTLGDMYFLGQGIEINHAEAIKWFSKSAARGDKGAQFKIARILEIGDRSVRNPLKALEEYKKSASRGNFYAEFVVGRFYEEGIVVPKDIARAIQSYKAAAPHVEEARAKLAKLYSQGNGVQPDLEEAYKWLETVKVIANQDKELKRIKIELESALSPEQRKAAIAKIEAYIKQHNIQQDEL